MKSNFKFYLILAPLGILSLIGCNTQYPSSYLPSTGPNPGLVINFESGLAVNPGLAEVNRPGNVVAAAGSAALGGSGTTGPSIALVSPGAANTSQCIHVTGSVTDPGNATYPSLQFQVSLDTSGAGFYDAGLFTGVKFYLKVQPGDTAGKRSFSIPVAQTQPPSAKGTCNLSASPNACYNDFASSYPNTNGNWQLLTLPFSSLARGPYGAAISPTTLSGLNLQQILMLNWAESNNNVSGTVNVDFYLDEVQFF